MKKLFSYEDVAVFYENDTLKISNSCFSRTFDLSSGAPRTVSLVNASGRELASADKESADFAFIGMYSSLKHEKICWQLENVSACFQEGSFRDAACVQVTLDMYEPFSETKYKRVYFIYPEFPVLGVQNTITAQVQPMGYWTTRLEKHTFVPNQPESIADSICCAEDIAPVLAVKFRGRTDFTNELVVEKQVSDEEHLCGNLLFCSAASGEGFCFIQEAPPSEERRDFETYDFRLSGKEINSCSWGIHPSEVERGKTFTGYRHDLLLYSSEEERILLLKRFLKKRFSAKPLHIMVNPWGCGKFPEYLTEAFLVDEFRASGEIGADFYQIDDQWQAGGGLANLLAFNRRIREDYWHISHEKLNGTFAPIIAAAEKAGVKPALWMAPSCNASYCDWQSFAEQIIGYYREYGFTNFKIDAVLIRSKAAEDNLRALLDHVRTATDGAVSFNLDTTNGQRPGYFLFMEYGNIFLENRYLYTWREKAYDYHPERTLRNLWELTCYINPSDLQIEIPCASDMDPEYFKDIPAEERPDFYPAEYRALIPFFANILIWTAPSKISEEEKQLLRSVCTLHKKYREALAGCEIFSIGCRPSGASYTGFWARNGKRGKSFLLLFRERNAQEERFTFDLKSCGELSWRPVTGKGTLLESGKDTVTVEMPPCGALLLESCS